MNADFAELEIGLEELSHLTGLTVETIRGVEGDEPFQFSLLPKFLRPYRYLIYAALTALLIPAILSFLAIVIFLPIIIIFIAVSYFFTSLTPSSARSNYRVKAIKTHSSKLQTALKNLTLQVQEHNILVRQFKGLSASADAIASPDEAANRAAAQMVLLCCRQYLVEVLQLERQLREGLVDATKSWGATALPVLLKDLSTNRQDPDSLDYDPHYSSSEEIAASSEQLLSRVDEQRDRLREKLGEQKPIPLVDRQQLEKAKASRYGRVINASLQVLSTVQREIRSLLSH